MPFIYLQQKWTFQEIKRYCACDDDTVHRLLLKFGQFVDPTSESLGNRKGLGKGKTRYEEETFAIGIAEMTPLTVDDNGNRRIISDRIVPGAYLRLM